MKEILISAGFIYAGDRHMPCCHYNVYHKTVDNKLCAIGIAEYKKKFYVEYMGQKRYHINNPTAPINGQLEYELKQTGMINSVAQ